MDALEMTLLFDYYGDLLTQRQKLCFDMRYNQDLSLSEIAEELQVSRQGVFDNLNRAEALLRNMEEKTGCVRRDLNCRRAAERIAEAAKALSQVEDGVRALCRKREVWLRVGVQFPEKRRPRGKSTSLTGGHWSVSQVQWPPCPV